ncbi:MAG: hypothetical protein LBO73_03010, partial [Holosporaceae bacterium]|nr:hypothetical protein [Holosporaceae bacterium]
AAEKISENVFTLGKTEVGYTEANGDILVYQVENIIPPVNEDPKEREKYAREFQSLMIDDMYQQLIGYLSERYGVTVNQELLKEIDEEMSPDLMTDMMF